MKTYIQIQALVFYTAIGFLAAGCGKKSATRPEASGTQQNSQTAATAPEIDAALFERITVRVNSLIQQKQYPAASETLKQLDNVKLTPAQQSTFDSLKAQISK